MAHFIPNVNMPMHRRYDYATTYCAAATSSCYAPPPTSPPEYSYHRVPDTPPVSEPRSLVDETPSWVGTKAIEGFPQFNDDDIEIGSRDEAEDGKEEARRLAELKTTVFDTYAVCAALLSSFSASTNLIPQAEVLNEPPWRQYTVHLQQILVRFCIIGGIHAMLIFMFCALYAKTALARATYGLEVYNMFSKATGKIRQSAFWSMYYTAILYCFQIAISTCYSMAWKLAAVSSFILFLLIMRVVYDAQNIIKSAGFIFMPDEQVRKLLDEEKNGDMLGSASPGTTLRSSSGSSARSVATTER